jgi:5'-3' exonuclease
MGVIWIDEGDDMTTAIDPTRSKRQAEARRRVEQVREWIEEGRAREDIVSLCQEQWDIKTRQADEYISRAKENIADQIENAAATDFSWHVRMRLSLFRRANATDDVQKALAVLKDLATLQGMYKAEPDVGAQDDYEKNLREALARFLP